MNQKNIDRLIDSVKQLAFTEDMTDILERLTTLTPETSLTEEGQALIAEVLDMCLI